MLRANFGCIEIASLDERQIWEGLVEISLIYTTFRLDNCGDVNDIEFSEKN